MAEETPTSEPAEDPILTRWREPSERLRSTARIFVTSLAAVAVTVVAGLSLTGLGQLTPGSPAFAFAVAGALLASLGVVALVALSVRLASSSAVSISELTSATNTQPGLRHAFEVVNDSSNGLLAGETSLAGLVTAAQNALEAERNAIAEVAADPAATDKLAEQQARTGVADWYREQLQSVASAAGFQRLRWNFGVSAGWMALAGAVTAIGIVMYAASLQPRTVPQTPVAVTVHESVVISAADSDAARALFQEVVGCRRNSVTALITATTGATVTAISLADGNCRSVTLSASWREDRYVADFGSDLEPEPEETAASTPG